MYTTQVTFHQRALALVKRVWHMYILQNDAQGAQEILSALTPDAVIIGTGKHEFYITRDAFVAGLMRDQAEAQSVAFEIIDEWYTLQPVTADVCMVYGTLWVREKESARKQVFVEMDSRFSAVCRDAGDHVEITHLHHSMPYIDQQEGEYYPKTLSGVAEQVLAENRRLARRLELDALTELYNRIYSERHMQQAMRAKCGVFYMIDLDDFKRVNDTLGHITGDDVIRDFARLLRDVFPDTAIIGRMGGDEFALWDGSARACAQAEAHAQALLARSGEIGAKYGVLFGCSVGIAQVARAGADFLEVYARADQALYSAKKQGKAAVCWA
nr:diguanylate cyclase [Maliibacterium massiliense]